MKLHKGFNDGLDFQLLNKIDGEFLDYLNDNLISGLRMELGNDLDLELYDELRILYRNEKLFNRN